MERIYMHPIFLTACIMLVVGCSQLPTATGEVAQAVAKSAQVVQASEVGKMIHQDINIPISYVVLIAFVAWNVRTPFAMIKDFLGMRKMK